MESIAGQIAKLVLDKFASLPRRCKPRDLPGGGREWTPMSAVVLSKLNQRPHEVARPQTNAYSEDELSNQEAGCSELELQDEHSFKVVSLATGTKSLPVSALPKCNGLVLHDCHAEVLALRGFNYWLLSEIEQMFSALDLEHPWLRLNINSGCAQGSNALAPSHLFELRSEVQISLFSTTAPCGDASMDLMARSVIDSTPWPEENVVPGVPLGRGHFSLLGRLRRKPARADAEISMSMSCTDKLMLTQFLGVLRFPVNVFMDSRRCKLRRMIVYEEEYDEIGYRRAFSRKGRLQKVIEQGVEATFFDVEVVPKDFRRFDYAKPRFLADDKDHTKVKVCNFSTVWIAGPEESDGSGMLEQIVNGVKQGFKQWDSKPAKGSVICHQSLMKKAFEIDQLMQRQGLKSAFSCSPDGAAHREYSHLKQVQQLPQKKLKHYILGELGGWPDKAYNDDFNIAFAVYLISPGSR